MYRNILQNKVCYIFGTLIGILATLGEEVVVNNTVNLGIRTVVHGVIYSIFGILFIYFGKKIINIFLKKDIKIPLRLNNLISDNSIHGTRKFWLVLWIAWLPYVILLFPGIVWFDTATELLQMRNLPNIISSGQLTDHHPVFDTLVFYAFVQVGNFLHSGNLGVFLYTLFQSLITTLTIAYVLKLWQKSGVSDGIIAYAYIFFVLFPFVPIYSIAMVKDALFIPVFLLFITHFALLILDKISISKKTILLLFCEALLMILVKKTGLYIVIISSVISFFIIKRKKMKYLMSSLLLFAVSAQVLLSFVIFPFAGIAPGGKQEMLVVPFQQATRVLVTEKNVDTEYREAVENLLGKDVSQRYWAFNGDNIKGNNWDEKKESNLNPFLKQWARGIFLYPKSYIEAWLSMESSWITLPHAQIKDDMEDSYLMQVYAEGIDYDTSFNHYKEYGLSNNDKRAGRLIQDIILWFNGTPLGSLLFSRAVWTTWFFFLMLSLIFEKQFSKEQRKNYFICILPFIVSYLFLWVSSNSGSIESMRYAMSVVIPLPIVVCIIKLALHNNQKSISK